MRVERQGARVRDELDKRRAQVEDPRDRALLTEIAYGVIRHRGTLDWLLGKASHRPFKKLSGAVRTALRMGLYQLIFLDRIPDHAAVDQAVAWASKHGGPGKSGYVNGVLRAMLRRIEGPARGPERVRQDVIREDGSAIRFRRPVFVDPKRDLDLHLATRFSAPAWLVTRWRKAFGVERVEALLRAGVTRPPIALRTRGARDALAAWLKARDVAFEAGPVDTALLLRGAESAAADAVAEGMARVQDATSQRIAPLLAPRAGMRVLDLCAAPGGKTVHLADLMGSGTVVACDVDASKVEALRDLADVVAPVTLETVVVPADGPLPFEPGSFDAILIDAPCSNTGVLRRRVEARWRLQPADIDALAALQQDLLERALPLLAPGGTLVYSTCSIEREENEDVLAACLAAHPELEGEVVFRVWPGRDADGGFAAVLRAAK